jgi:predicted alpha/beta superfamily hydrolase
MAASPLSGAYVHDLHSASVGDDFRIFLGWCGAPDPAVTGSARPIEVLYLLDANCYFGATVDIIRMLQTSAHLPPLLVIGVGYPVLEIRDTLDQRTRDLTPSADPDYAALVPTPLGMGGAAAFRRFLIDELRPWVEIQVRARGLSPAAAPMLFGHSLGGLFATYVLLSEPTAFGRYGIGSPSLWWHGKASLALEHSAAAARADLPAQVFLGVGALETHAGRQLEASRLSAPERAITASWPIDMVADTHQLARQLESRKYPGLSLRTCVFDDEFHISVWPLVLSRALRSMFGAPSADSHVVGADHYS